jgi:hypothetical protein
MNPAEFERANISSPRANGFVPVLRHLPSEASFTFDFEDNQHWANYTPGYDRPLDERAAGNWDGQLNYVKQWLGYLKREWLAPNLWAELQAQRDLVAGLAEHADGNTPFTNEEQAEIARKLGEVKTYVRQTRDLTGAQYEAIETKLDYLAGAAGRLGRFDWRNTFVGAFVGAVIQSELPPEPVQDILNLALRGLGHLFGVHIPELPR